MNRRCPDCNKIIKYKNEKSHIYAAEKNSKCKKCAAKSRIGVPRNEKTKEKIRKAVLK